jgi:hypothetical protein
MTDVSDELSGHLFEAATSSDVDAETAVAEMLMAAESEQQEYQVFLENDRCRFLLSTLAANFLAMAQLRDVKHRRILKYAFDHELERRKVPGPWELLGWQPFGVETEIPAASHAQSYHVEIEIPEELSIDGSAIIDEDSLEIYAVDGETDRASLYASRVPIGVSPVLYFAIRAERVGFPAMAAAVAWITAVILGIGAIFGDLSSFGAGPAISILLAGSALFAGAVVSTGEHRLVQARFLIPRLLLALSASSALIAGAALAFQLCNAVDTIWDVSALIAAVVAAILSVTLIRAATTTPLKA